MRKLVFQSFLITTIIAVAIFMVPHSAAAQAADVNGGSCSLLSLSSLATDCLYGIIGKIFWWVLIPIGGLVLQLLGAIIDTAVGLSLDPSFYNSEAIGIAWSIIRDLANMIFIFVLIFEGVKTILNIGNLASVKRTIAGVLMAAILLNFSLFFTKAMIDVSNLGTAWFVQGITNLGDGTSMSSSVRAVLQMEKLTKSSGGENFLGDFKEGLSLRAFMQGFLLFALICVAIYVFFQMTFLIIGRIVAFIFLLITAPVGFTGPFFNLGDYSKKAGEWWDEMLKQLMMLPMFFLMLYLTLFMVDRFDKLLFDNSAASTEFTPVNYVIFIIIIMMMLKALDTAKQYSGDLGGSIAKVAKGAVSFATGSIAMGTIGRAARVVGNNATFQKWAAGNSEGSGITGSIARGSGMVLGRMTMSGVKGAAGANFGMKSGMKESGLDKAPLVSGQFKGTDKGYEGKISQEKKDTEAFMKDLGKGISGEKNRIAYAERQKNNLYNKVTGNAYVRGAGGIMGAVVGGVAGSALGPIGAATGATVGGYMGSNLTDQEIAESGADGLKKAQKEYKKEAGKIAKEAMAEVDKTPEISEIKQNIEESKEELQKARKAADRLENLYKQETDLIVSLNKFNKETHSIDGNAVDLNEFENKLKKTEEQLKKTRESIVQTKELAESSSEIKTRIEQQESALRTQREMALFLKTDRAEKLASIGIQPGSESWKRLSNVMDEGEKITANEDAEKARKAMEKAMKEGGDEAPKPKEDSEEKKG